MWYYLQHSFYEMGNLKQVTALLHHKLFDILTMHVIIFIKVKVQFKQKERDPE